MLPDVRKIAFERQTEARIPESGGFDALRRGVKGGFVATVVMTAFRIPIAQSLPPTTNFWAKYIGTGGPADYTLQAVLRRLLYGIGSGVVFASFCAPPEIGLEAKNEWQGILRATLFGLLLSVFGVRVVLKRLLGWSLSRTSGSSFT